MKSELMLMRRARAYSMQFLFAGNLDLAPYISSQFTLLQPKIAKKSLKINIFRVQGHSRSSMLTFLKSSTSVLVVLSSMSVRVCNHFHARQDNSGQITTFLEGYRYLTLTCASLFESRGSGLGLLKSAFNGKNAVCRLSWPISIHFGAIHYWNAYRSPKSRKIHKSPLIWGFRVIHGHPCWHF